MEKKDVRKVMKKYGRAWENLDVGLLLECFTSKGVYHESPISKPHKGHKAIKKFWNEEIADHTKNIKFTLGRCYVSDDKKTGFAEWRCINNFKGRKDTMVGIMLLKMRGEKITYLNEYWNTKTEIVT